VYSKLTESLRSLYLEDPRPWLVGFSGGKDSTLVAALIFEVAASIPVEKRTKQISVLCTDTRVEIPAIVEKIEGMLDKMRRYGKKTGLNIDVHLLKPPPDQSFWVNLIGNRAHRLPAEMRRMLHDDLLALDTR
jgi:DNA sulfur modification protein DndC